METRPRRTSNSKESEERTALLWRWVLERWPQFIFWTGLLSFASACLNSERLPVEAVFVGPLLMLAGVVMMHRNKRETQLQRWNASSRRDSPSR